MTLNMIAVLLGCGAGIWVLWMLKCTVKSYNDDLSGVTEMCDRVLKRLQEYNTQMAHYHVRIQVLVEKINELECHHDQLKRNMLVMHQNNQMLHDQMKSLNEKINNE